MGFQRGIAEGRIIRHSIGARGEVRAAWGGSVIGYHADDGKMLSEKGLIESHEENPKSIIVWLQSDRNI